MKIDLDQGLVYKAIIIHYQGRLHLIPQCQKQTLYTSASKVNSANS